MDVRAEKEGEFIELFDVYGELLTENQKEVCRSYLEYDLSLGEIAEDKGVSRQSVSDCLKKSCRRLKEFEEILGTIALKKEIAERSRKCEEALFAAEGAEKDLESRFYSAEGNVEAFATLRGALADLKRITATKES